jgi:hypothetical protein
MTKPRQERQNQQEGQLKNQNELYLLQMLWTAPPVVLAILLNHGNGL